MKVKICGITDVNEIYTLNIMKPDYIGFVFAEKSIRNVTRREAEILYKLVDKDIKVVGVFRNNTKDFIEDILKYIPLDVIQLHGAEDEKFIEYFNKNYSCEVWKGEAVNSLEDLKKALKLPVSTLILDSKSPGSGKVFPWQYLESIKTDKKIMLAGGINADNIEQAVIIKNIQGIDVSSGAESIIEGIRRKDPIKMKKIIRKVREKDER